MRLPLTVSITISHDSSNAAFCYVARINVLAHSHIRLTLAESRSKYKKIRTLQHFAENVTIFGKIS